MIRRLVTDGQAVTAEGGLTGAATLPDSGISLTDVWLSAAGAQVGPGETAVVRGLRHAWVNRGDVDCVMACVSVSARPAA